VQAAALARADRVELCTDLDLDGLTPPPTLVRAARRAFGGKLHLLVRPRAGDFVFSSAELAAMLAAVERCRAEGVDGVAVGCLTPDRAIDEPAMRELTAAAQPMSVTFHRAFDACGDRVAELETLVRLGVDRVLTSGGGRSADAPGLAALVAQARERIGIIAAGGIRDHNVAAIVQGSGVREIHFAERLLPAGAPAMPERLAEAIRRIMVHAGAGR
jgi:copper homeostasis protein